MAFGSERSVKVKLKADISEYIGPLGIAAEETKKFRSSVEGLDVALKPLDSEADKAGDELKQLGKKADAAGDQMKETAGDAGLLTAALKAEGAAADDGLKVKDRNIVQSKVYQSMLKSQTDAMWESKKVVDKSSESLGRLSDDTKTSILNSKVFVSQFRSQVDAMLASKKATEEAAKATREAAKANDEMTSSWRRGLQDGEGFAIKVEAIKRRIEALTTHVRNTGDLSVLGDLKKYRRDLKELESLTESSGRSIFQTIRGAVTGGLQAGFQGIGNLLNAGGGWGALVVGAIVVALLPAIGAAIGSALSGGAALAFLTGGIVLAIKNERVVNAWKEVGSLGLARLTEDAKVFVEPLMRAADHLYASFVKIEPSVQRIFGGLAPVIDRLARGLGGFFEKAMPGIEGGIFKGGIPILNTLANQLPLLGKEVGNFFRSISQPEAVRSFKYLLDGLGGTIVFLGKTIELLTWAFDGLFHLVGGALHVWSDALHAFNDSIDVPEPLKKIIGSEATMHAVDKASAGFDKYMDRVNHAADANDNFDSTIDGTWHSLDHTTEALKATNEQFSQLADTLFKGWDASIAFNQAMLDLDTSVKKSGTSLSSQTQIGLDNQKMIVGSIKLIEKQREDALALGDGSVEAQKKADDAYHASLEALRQHLYALGFNKKAVDAYIDAAENVPKNIATNFTANMAQAQAQIAGYRNALDKIPGSITTMLHVVANENSIAGFSVTRHFVQRWGGVAEHADTGLIRDAKVYRSGSRPLYAFAEPQTGGEAFVPKYGDYSRSTSILDHAARWYGGRFMPGGGGGVSGRIEIVLSGGDASTEAVLSLLRKAVNMRGGNVQAVIAGNN